MSTPDVAVPFKRMIDPEPLRAAFNRSKDAVEKARLDARERLVDLLVLDIQDLKVVSKSPLQLGFWLDNKTLLELIEPNYGYAAFEKVADELSDHRQPYEKWFRPLFDKKLGVACDNGFIITRQTWWISPLRLLYIPRTTINHTPVG